MKVDSVLILAAGKGTRMGEIGKEVPKVIWPIFNKSILELEVIYARKFNPSKIFINLYHYKDQILSHKEKRDEFKDVEFVEEKAQIDIGGAIHNVAEKLNYEGKLLILNSDQYIILKDEVLESFVVASDDCDCLLSSHTVNSKDGYNAFKLDGKRIKGIIPNKECIDKKVITYTGMSLINLSKIKPRKGESSFFDSVANFHQSKVHHFDVNEGEYWDFGTLSRYYHSLLRLATSNSQFKSFLIENGVVINAMEGSKLKVDENFSLSNLKVEFKNQSFSVA